MFASLASFAHFAIPTGISLRVASLSRKSASAVLCALLRYAAISKLTPNVSGGFGPQT